MAAACAPGVGPARSRDALYTTPRELPASLERFNKELHKLGELRALFRSLLLILTGSLSDA